MCSSKPLSILIFTAILGLFGNAAVFAQTSGLKAAGEAVYKQRCAGCHEQTNPRIPARSSLNQMPATRILSTLDFGVMMTVAYPMSRDEREAVAAYLGTDSKGVSFPATAYCSEKTVAISAKAKSSWNGWSPDQNNTRF